MIPAPARALLFLILFAGCAACLVSAHYLLKDWAALMQTYSAFARIEFSGRLADITVAYDIQGIYRINCFADGVGVLLGAILAAIGAHGLAVASTIARSPASHFDRAGSKAP